MSFAKRLDHRLVFMCPISKYIDRGKFILRLQNASIMRQLQNQSVGPEKSGVYIDVGGKR